MTLTTERQQFEQWWETAMHNGYPPRFGWEHWRDGGGYRDDDGEFQGLWQAWQASRGFLANREAQPVAWHFPGSDTESAQLGYDHELDDEQKHNCIALYAAPPAPAVPEKCPEHVRSLMNIHADDLFDDADAQEIWNACRSAMLAQPVSSGYTLNSPEIPDGYHLAVVPLEGTEAFRAACTAAFNEYERGTGPCGVFIAGHRSMLAAAPEGRN